MNPMQSSCWCCDRIHRRSVNISPNSFPCPSYPEGSAMPRHVMLPPINVLQDRHHPKQPKQFSSITTPNPDRQPRTHPHPHPQTPTHNHPQNNQDTPHHLSIANSSIPPTRMSSPPSTTSHTANPSTPPPPTPPSKPPPSSPPASPSPPV